MSLTSIQEVVKNDLCTGCGVCTSNSSSTMHWNDNGFLVPTISKDLAEDTIKLCPFNPYPDDKIKDEDKLSEYFFTDKLKMDTHLGRFIDTYVGSSKRHRETSSSGGLATYVFEQLLERKIVEHLFIVKEINGVYQYQWFNNVDQIKSISKTRYFPVTLEKLFKEIDSKKGKVAVSGVACFIKAIRLKQYYYPNYEEKIPFLVGLICGGLKSKFFTDYLAQSCGVTGEYSRQEYRIKDKNSSASDYSFGAFNELKEFHQMKMNTVGDMWGSGLFKANACEYCSDVTTELADISLGDAWLHPYSQEGLGYNMIVTRSEIANQIIKEGILNEELAVKAIPKSQVIASQSGGFNHKHKALFYRYTKAQKSNTMTPYVRKRIFERIPFEFKRVQNMRLKTRKESFNLWRASYNSTAFDYQMNVLKNKLKTTTIFYHRIQKLKNIFNIK